MRTKAPSKAGFTLVEIMIVVATIGMLASIAIPNFVRARTSSQMNACVNNLRQIDGAVQQWALEKNQAPTADVTLDNATLYLRNRPVCPAGGTTMQDSYAVTKVSEPPTCIAPGGGAANLHVLPQ